MTKHAIKNRFLYHQHPSDNSKHLVKSSVSPKTMTNSRHQNLDTVSRNLIYPPKKHKNPLFFLVGVFLSKPPKTITSKLSKKRKWIAFLLLILVVLPAQASVFDPLVRVLLPVYEKITSILPNNNKPNSTEPNDTLSNSDNSTITELSRPDNETQNHSPDLLVLLQAEFAADRDDLQTALILYKEQSFKDNATAVFERALSLSMQLESPTQSLAFAKAWQEQNPDHTPAWFYVAHLAVKAEDYAAITQSIAAILTYDPKADLNQIFAGILPHSLDAKHQLLNALQALPNKDNPSLSVLKAALLLQLNVPRAALLHVDEALKVEPTNLAYLTLKADTLTYLGDETTLIQFLSNATASTSGDTQKQLYLYQARHLIDNSNLAQAWAVLKAAQKHFDGDIELTLLASLVALDVHEYSDADILLNKLSLHPSTQSEAYYYLGISHERRQKFSDALAYFRLVDDMQFVLPATQKQVAYELMFNNPDGAIAALIRLRERYEMYASDSYTLQADILVRQNKKQEAITLLQNAYTQYPDDNNLLYAYTKLLDDSSDYLQKQTNLQALLTQEPDNPHYQLEQARLNLLRDPDDLISLDTVLRISQIDFSHLDYDSQLHLDALIVLANNALTKHNYQAVLDYLQPAYSVTPNINIGVLLLRAHQGLGNTQAVNELLNELQAQVDNSTPNQTLSEQY